MDSMQPIKVKFKLEKNVIEENIEKEWSIGKIKGKVRKFFKINPYYILQLIYNGQILENSSKFKEINYKPDGIIKVMASRPADI